jgi:5'(3')-deoxyribonucleotidase
VNILLDVDGLLGNFVAGALRWVHSSHGKAFTQDQVTDYNLMTSFGLPDKWPAFTEWLSDTRFCREVPVYDGAIAFVDELRKLGRVVAVTTPFVGVDHWENDRRSWLEQHFAIGHKDLVFCKDKTLVHGQILFDDKVENAEAFGQVPGQIGALFSQPWNASHSGGNHVRVNGYAGALRLVREYRKAAGL